jgi:hypothetical protein
MGAGSGLPNCGVYRVGRLLLLKKVLDEREMRLEDESSVGLFRIRGFLNRRVGD